MPVEAHVKRRCSVCHASYTRGESFCSRDGGAIVADDTTIEDELAGKTIDGRYKVSRLLGSGGMGRVYEADHIGLGKRVAIKFVSDADADREQRARFRQEARAASQIVHENVVQILDVGVDGGRDFIVMEYVEGRDLDALLREVGPLAPARAIAITQQMLRGLHASHAAGIVHRDIKPSNIRLTNSSDFVKIMDFGIAKSVHAEVAQTDTGTGRVIGTPQFMAPEQVLDGVVDHRADLYAAGATLYSMLAGKPPFASTSFTQRVEALASPAPALDELRSDLPPSLVAAVARALARSPEDRFPDALAFAAALGDHVPIEARGEVVTKPMLYPGFTPRESARPVPVTPRRWTWLVVAIAALVTLALATAVIIFALRPPPAPTVVERVIVVSPDAAPAVAVVPADAAVDAAAVVPIDAALARKRIAPKPTDVLPSGTTGTLCRCKVTTERGSITYGCRQKAADSRCSCEDPNHNRLCPFVITVTNGSRERLPDGTRSGTMNCVDRARPECDPLSKDMPKDCWASEHILPHGNHKTACRGYKSGLVEGDAMLEGTYRCSLCARGPTAPKYRGKDGEACVGYEVNTGEKLSGVLECD